MWAGALAAERAERERAHAELGQLRVLAAARLRHVESLQVCVCVCECVCVCVCEHVPFCSASSLLHVNTPSRMHYMQAELQQEAAKKASTEAQTYTPYQQTTPTTQAELQQKASAKASTEAHIHIHHAHIYTIIHSFRHTHTAHTYTTRSTG